MIVSERIQKSLKDNVFWITQLDWVEDSTQWVWNVHISLEWWTWVKNDEEKLKTILENSVKKTMYKYTK